MKNTQLPLKNILRRLELYCVEAQALGYVHAPIFGSIMDLFEGGHIASIYLEDLKKAAEKHKEKKGMKIAFDVLGTINGYRQSEVLRLFRSLQAKGHEMFVWSSDFGMAVNAVKTHGLNATPLDKFSHSEAEEKGFKMDVCIEDDHSQTWLAARAIVFVDEMKLDNNENLKLVADKLTLTESSTDSPNDD